MADKEIIVPKLEWLIGGSRIGLDYNRYTGSVGTDPNKGCFKEKIFNYTVFIIKEDDTEKIKAVTFSGLKCLEQCDAQLVSERLFPCEAQSIDEIKKWIESKRDEYYG